MFALLLIAPLFFCCSSVVLGLISCVVLPLLRGLWEG